jgi:hypothetical protein
MDECKFQDLEINSETASVQRSGGRIDADSKNYLIPFNLFHGHAAHTASQVLSVRVDETTWMVVPCIELIRFYFGESGHLVKTLFSGRFALRELVEGCWIRDGNANVVLPAGMNFLAAPGIARICFDASAKSAVRMLIHSGSGAALDQRPWYPKMGFPFTGMTNLTVRGKWLQHDDRRIFLALRLVTCTHPFPFEKLFHRGKRVSTDAEHPTRVQRKAASQTVRKPIEKRITLTNRPELEGSRSLVSLPEHDIPFPDLLGKPIVPMGEFKVVGTQKRGATSAEIATTGGHAGVPVQGAELAAKQVEGLDPNDAPIVLWHIDWELRALRPDLVQVQFKNRLRFGRTFIDATFAGLNSQRWVGLAVLRAADSETPQPTLILVCAEDRVENEAIEFMALMTPVSHADECVGLLHRYLLEVGWRTGELTESGTRCILALSSAQMERAFEMRSVSEIVNSISSQMTNSTVALPLP